MTYCPAYHAIEAAARKAQRPLSLAEVIAVMTDHPDTLAAWKRVSDELNSGCGHDPDTIAERLQMPAPFVASFLIAFTQHLARGQVAFARVN
jgi:hypothetical protein